MCEVQSNVREALSNDFDTPKAMSELLTLLSSVNSYLDLYSSPTTTTTAPQSSQQQQLPPPELPLYACNYIDRMLKVFGLNILPSSFNQV